MTDFLSTGTLPDDYQQLAKTVRDFARTVLAPVAAKHDHDHSFPYEVVAGMADMGLFGLPFPEEHGGMGGDYFALRLVLSVNWAAATRTSCGSSTKAAIAKLVAGEAAMDNARDASQIHGARAS